MAALASALLAFTFSSGVRALEPGSGDVRAHDDARAHFQAGRSAFETGNYAAAVQAFEAALAAGLAGPAVHFNIGVAAYRLGDHRRAAAAFEQSARAPEMAALSYYNLGLVALAADKPGEAKRWFSRTERESTDERVRNLADTQLSELEAQEPESTLVGYAAIAAGHDDNVALISHADVLGVTGTADEFAELQLAFARPVGPHSRLDAGAVLVDYQDLDAFDQFALQAGAHYRVPIREWTGDIGVQLAHTTLDGDAFENRRMLVLQARTLLRDRWGLQTRYRFSDIEGMSGFDGISGRRHEADARIAWSHGVWGLGVEYRVDFSDQDDDALSAHRHQLRVDIERELPQEWSVAFETTRRHSRYALGANGSEDWTELALTLARPLTAHWRLLLRYAYADNDADRPEFEYSRSRASAGVEAVL